MSQPNTSRLQGRSRADSDQRRRILEVAKGLSATLGNDFFRSMVKSLGIELHADCVYLGELTGSPANRMKSIAVYRGRRKAEDFEQTLSGTAAGQVVQDGSFARSQEVRQIFPQDTELEAMLAEGYAGTRLSDSTGQPIGLLAMASHRVLRDLPLVKSVLETFAPRAAAELERKRADDLRRENEERYHAFISTNPDAMWRVEFEQPIPLSLPEEEQLELMYRLGYLAECNDASARLYGHRSAEDFVGCRFNEIVPLTDTKLLRELRQQIHSGFRSPVVETSRRDENGNSFWRLRSQFAIVENGNLRRFWGTTRDLTELKRAELLVAASERRFRQVFESVQLPTVILDADGAVAFCNESFLRLVNRSRTDVAERRWLKGIITAEEVETWRAAFTDEGPAEPFQGAILPESGSPRIVLWTTIRLQNEEDAVTSIAAIGRDVSYERALEAENRLAQKMESAGRLAAGVAHDFNNILAVVRGQTEQLLASTEASDPARERLRAIDDAVLRCISLVDQLLTFGRKQHLRPEHIDVDEVIAAEAGIVSSMLGEGIELVIRRASHPWLVYADPRQIQRIISNLVSNARDAMRRGGRLVIETSNVTIREQDPAYPGVQPGAFVRLSVTDDGIGLTREVQQQIFEPFFSAKQSGKGIGLGLPTVYGIVAQSGGHITVRSEAGKGTTVEILLPGITRDAP